MHIGGGGRRGRRSPRGAAASRSGVLMGDKSGLPTSPADFEVARAANPSRHRGTRSVRLSEGREAHGRRRTSVPGSFVSSAGREHASRSWEQTFSFLCAIRRRSS